MKAKDRILSIAVLLILQLSLGSCFETCEEATRRIYLDENFEGAIDSVIEQPKDQKLPYCLIGYSKHTINNRVYKEFSKGDIIIKHSGSMKYYWVKGNDTTVFYQECGRYPVQD